MASWPDRSDGIQGQGEQSREAAPNEPVMSSVFPSARPLVRPHGRIALRGYVLWDRLDLSWKLALWLLVTLRVGLGLIAVWSIHLTPVTQSGGMLLNLIVPSGDPWTQTLSTWQRYDALWYQQIAEHGYKAGTGTGAFYPLYPLLSRVVSLPLGGHIVLAELCVSSVAFVLAMWLLYQVARFYTDHRAAALTVLLTAFFPMGFFFLAPYTESLYLALTLAVFYFIQRNQFWVAGVAGLGAALCHEPGVFLALPLAYEYLRRCRAAGRRPALGLLSAGLPVLGPISVEVYQRFIVGEQRSILAMHASYPWGYQRVGPWQALSDSWIHIVQLGDSIEFLNLVAIIGFSLLALWATRRLPLGYALYVWPYLALLFTREMLLSPLMSVARLVMVLFPCFIVLAIWLARRPWLSAAWLVVSALMQIALLEYWVRFGFVG